MGVERNNDGWHVRLTTLAVAFAESHSKSPRTTRAICTSYDQVPIREIRRSLLTSPDGHGERLLRRSSLLACLHARAGYQRHPAVSHHRAIVMVQSPEHGHGDDLARVATDLPWC